MKVALHTLGCKVNFAEMAELGDRLAKVGFQVSEDEAGADVCIINSCTVTAQADRKLRTLAHGLRRRAPQAHLILTGCHVDNPNPRVSAVGSVDASFSNRRKDELFDYVTANFAPDPAPGSSSFSRARYFLKVQDGCDHRCTYCIVWRTRGESRSLSQASLIRRAVEAVEQGYREIVLTGVDLGAYGREQGGTLSALVEAMLAAIAPARLRLSSINANDLTAELIDLAAEPRLCPHFHIPLQSGSDRVLKRMGRLYRRADYLQVVSALRVRRPELAVTTDVIVGFPGESDEDFEQTRSIAEEAELTGLHVFRYSPRAGTAAPRLGLPVDDPLSRERSRILQQQADRQRRAYEARFIGIDLEVVWDRRFPQRLRGLSGNYITVYSSTASDPVGSMGRVRPLAAVDDGLLCA